MQDQTQKKSDQKSPGFNLTANRGIPTPGVAGPGQMDEIFRQNGNQPMTLEELMQQMPTGQQNQLKK